MNQEGGAKGLLQPDAATSVSTYWHANDLLDTLPVATYICDRNGFLKRYNEEAARLWGRHPAVNLESERFAGALSLHHPNGAPLPQAAAVMVFVSREIEPPGSNSCTRSISIKACS